MDKNTDGKSTKESGPQQHKPFSCLDDYFEAPMASYPLASKIFMYVCIGVIWLVTKIYFRWTSNAAEFYRRHNAAKAVKGAAGEPALGKVFICNHASMFDPVVLIMNSVLNHGALRPLYKSELNKNKAAAWLFSRVGARPIKRGSADLKALHRAVASIKQGEDVLIFPEGTRIRNIDARPEVHGGFSMIALMAGCDIVPVCIDGSQNISPTGHGFVRPAKVRIHYGDPIELSRAEGTTRKEKSASLEALAMRTIYDMRDQLRREHGLPVSRPGADVADAASSTADK